MDERAKSGSLLEIRTHARFALSVADQSCQTRKHFKTCQKLEALSSHLANLVSLAHSVGNEHHRRSYEKDDLDVIKLKMFGSRRFATDAPDIIR